MAACPERNALMKTHVLTTTHSKSGALDTLRVLVRLTKPGVTLLLVFTAVTTAVAASGPWFSPWQLLLLALSGGLAAGGAGAINHYLEKDLDRQMPRTAARPLPAGQLADPRLALYWGIALAGAGLLLSTLTLPMETTLFTALGIVIYVPVYTLLLKRRTALNVVIGGAAGACPVLAGWTAARVDWPLLPLALALVVFFWTPAHFWAFAIRHEADYGQAGFPMLPNRIGMHRTAPYILLHAFFAVLASVIALRGTPLLLAAGSGLLFLGLCLALCIRPSKRMAYGVYKASNYYLMLVFLGLLLG